MFVSTVEWSERQLLTPDLQSSNMRATLNKLNIEYTGACAIKQSLNSEIEESEREGRGERVG
jgi:hypothetical protein